MTWSSQMVPRIGRIRSVVPSALIFWITVIILCEQQPGVHGDCQVLCSETYCACVGDQCVVDEEVPEGTPIETGLFNVSVDSEGIGIRITMQTGDADDLGVDGFEVYVREKLDFETVPEYVFIIDCYDGNSWSSEPDSLRHTMRVKDENELSPDFNFTIIYASVQENADIGTKLITDVPIKASDGDSKDTGFTYSISEDSPFRITEGCQEDEVFLYVNGTVEFEEFPLHNITIEAEDGCISGFDELKGNVTVIVQVNDTDDEPPAFDQDNYEVTIPERNQTFVYMGLSASDQDSLNALLQYSFIGQSGDWGCLDYLRIDSETAVVTLAKELDYETSLTPCTITVQAVQQNNCRMVGTTNLTVTVTDVNECPSIILDNHIGQLNYDDPFVITDDGSERLTIGMTDEDLTFSGNVTIEPSDLAELVEVTGREGNRTRSYFIKFLDPTSIMNDTDIQIFLSDDMTDVNCTIATSNIAVRIMPDSLAPNFTQIDYYRKVLENATEGTPVIQVEALNSDMTSDGIVYRLQMASDGGEDIFSVDDASGEVVVNDILNAEFITQYTLIIEAVDERWTYYRSSITSVIIDVVDVNEYPPSFAEDVNEVIEEEVPTDIPVLTVQATDLDVDPTLQYSIKETDVPFKIDAGTGEITTNGSLDRDEGITTYNLTVTVTDGISEDECLVNITLTDINDNAPEFGEGPFELLVPENTTNATTMEIGATDIDEGNNAEIAYMLETPDDNKFSVDEETGMVYANGPFDYEDMQEYTLVIRASDWKFSTVTTVAVTITDVNDNAPVFTTACSTTEVAENAQIDDVICTVLAQDTDDDGEDEVTYSLNPTPGVPFTVDPLTGEIKVNDALDRETEDDYTFIIIAEDSGQPPLSDNITITVTVLDVNDEDPKFEDTSISILRQEDELADPPVLLESVKATDKDLPPWNIIQCEKTSEGESFLVVTGQDGSCDIYASKVLTTSPDPYVVSFYAFNPDNRDRSSENVTLSVAVRDTVCYVIFVNDEDYDVIVSQSDLDTSIAVVTLIVTSNCNTDDIVFEQLSQSYQSDMMDAQRPSQNFTVDDQTGSISPKDYVMEGKHVLLVSAYNQSDPEVNETTTVSIVVTGLNQEPDFGMDVYTINITTDSMLSIIDLSNDATDPDFPSFATGEMIFFEVNETEVDSGSISDYFEVNPNGKVTTTTENLNNIEEGTFRLVVMVMDKAIDALNDIAVVLINVDIDQNIPVVDPPVITKDCGDTVEIEEETEPPQHICDIDASSEEQIVFGLDSASEYFSINPDSGEITTIKRLDYETDERSYTLLVYAEGMTSELRSYTLITVDLIDINDNKPDFSESQQEFSMKENSHDDCTTFIGRIQSTDADSEINQNVTYESDREDFVVQGDNLTAVECISRNDIEYSNGKVEVNITALNIGVKEDQTSYFGIVITIEDLNDQTPEFKNKDFSVNVEVLISGLLVFRGEAEDDDKGPYNNDFVFSLADGQEDLIYSLFQMSSDGNLTVRDTTIISDDYVNIDKHEIIVMVTDKGQPPLSSSQNVTVYVGIFDLAMPYFAVDDRTQTFEVEENSGQCKGFPVPQTCNGNDTVKYEYEVDPVSGKKYFSLNKPTNELCIEDLDREVSSLYTVIVTAYYEDPNDCNSTNGTTRKRREVREDEPNIIVFTITVIDEIDSPPSFQFPGNVSNAAYYLAAIDSTTIGSPVFTVTAKDEDATWEFVYTLTNLSGDNDEGPRNTIVINPSTGQITTNSPLYTELSDSVSWAWQNDSNFLADLTQDPYTVTVCDVLSPDETQCDTAELTFKILLSFEHIIIRFNEQVSSIMPQQNDIISCIAQKMDPTHQLELNLQFLSPAMQNGISSPDEDIVCSVIIKPSRTDMWLYGVDTSKLPSSPYLKFDDFMKSWDTDGLKECSDAEMTPTRLQLSKIIPDASRTSSLEAWVPIALGIIVFIGNLICIILLLISWRTMMEDSGRELARELTLKDEEVEKGFANPVFHYDNGAYDATEIMAAEADEDATGSEDPLITKVYLTDGKTQSTIAMTAGDEPKDVEKAVGTDDDVLVLPPLPKIRDYDSEEEILDVYPFDEPDESYEFNIDVQSDTVDIKTTPNDANDSAIIPDIASSSTDPTLPIPPADYETETKNRDGVESEESEENKTEDEEENYPLSKQQNPEAPAKPIDNTPKDGPIDPKVKTLLSELERRFNKEKDTKTTPNDSNGSPTTPNVDSSETDPTLPIPLDDNTTETKQRDEIEHEDKKTEENAPMEASDSGAEPDESLKDYDYPPPPVPLVVQETGEDPVRAAPLEDQIEDPPLPPPPPPILPPIDYADGKTVTFGGETVVGEGAGDGGSTTASEATEDTNQPRKRSRDAFLSEIERVAASFSDRSHRYRNRNIGLNNGAVGSPPPSPRSVVESEGESIGFLDDESLISASEIGVTSL